MPSDVTLNNRFALFTARDMTDPRADIWALPLDGGAPIRVLQTPFGEGEAVFSPDGTWIAYQMTERGPAFEVYIRPFRGSGEAIRVSSAGGTSPRWSRNGTELFYAGPNNELMVVGVSWNGEVPRTDTPRA